MSGRHRPLFELLPQATLSPLPEVLLSVDILIDTLVVVAQPFADGEDWGLLQELISKTQMSLRLVILGPNYWPASCYPKAGVPSGCSMFLRSTRT